MNTTSITRLQIRLFYSHKILRKTNIIVVDKSQKNTERFHKLSKSFKTWFEMRGVFGSSMRSSARRSIIGFFQEFFNSNLVHGISHASQFKLFFEIQTFQTLVDWWRNDSNSFGAPLLNVRCIDLLLIYDDQRQPQKVPEEIVDCPWQDEITESSQIKKSNGSGLWKRGSQQIRAPVEAAHDPRVFLPNGKNDLRPRRDHHGLWIKASLLGKEVICKKVRHHV